MMVSFKKADLIEADLGRKNTTDKPWIGKKKGKH